MMFTEFEKSLINTIVSQNTGTIRHFGYNGRNILFPTNESAVFIPRDTFRGGRYTSILFLLAYHDGGRTHAEMREKIVSFVSLMQYLEEHRLIYVMDASVRTPALFYSNYEHITLGDDTISNVEEIGNGRRRLTHTIDIDNGSSLRFKSIVEDGETSSYDNVHIQLPDGNKIGGIEYGYNIKTDLIRYLKSFVYPTKTLKDMVSNDFKTKTERIAEKSLIAAEKQVKKAQHTLIIAIITLISSIAIPILSCALPDCHSSIIKILCLIFCAFLLIVCGAEIARGNMEAN